MGILNVTPDSFSDGGLFFDAGKAIAHGLEMVAQGADLVDVGGESTRPGAPEVSIDDELSRVLPVVSSLVAQGVTVSIDTSKPEVAEAALGAGAAVVNDVTGLRDPDMIRICAESDCTVCIMHMLGTPRTMQQSPHYGDVCAEVLHYLLAAAEACAVNGIDQGRLWIDPGIGFGKTVHHNLQLLHGLEAFVETGLPVLIGVSRKSFLGHLTGGASADDRLEATLAAQVAAQTNGARIIRAHDVRAARRAIDVTAAILSA